MLQERLSFVIMAFSEILVPDDNSQGKPAPLISPLPRRQVLSLVPLFCRNGPMATDRPL